MNKVVFRRENEETATCFFHDSGIVRTQRFDSFDENALKDAFNLSSETIVVLAGKGCSPHGDMWENGYYCAPIALYLEISARCPYQCDHCFKGQSDYTRIMTNPEILNLIDQSAAMGVFQVRFAGYEPLANPDFFEIADYAKNKGLYLVLNTGVAHTEHVQRKILSFGFNELLVSLDGGQETHNTIRMPDSFDGVRRLLDISDSLGGLNKIKLSMTVNRRNIAAMGSVASIAAAHINVSANFIPYRNIGNTADLLGLSITADDMRVISETVSALRSEYPDTRIFQPYFDLCGNAANTYHSVRMNNPCVGSKNISVLANGQVYGCDFLRSLGDLFCAGSIFENSLQELWYGSVFLNRFRSLEKDETCRTCNYFMKSCSGGCTAESYLRTRSYYDPLCYIRNDKLKDADFYSEEYYINGKSSGISCYENYHFMPERTRADIEAIKSLIETHANTGSRRAYVDFGAAFGFLVREFLTSGDEAWGIDISDYARSKLRDDPIMKGRMFKSVTEMEDTLSLELYTGGWLIAKNALEHLTLPQLEETLAFAACYKMNAIIAVPLSVYDGGTYIDEPCNHDMGHLLRRSDAFWQSQLHRYFSSVISIDKYPENMTLRYGTGLYVCLSGEDGCNYA